MKAEELRIGNWVMYSSKIQVNENKIRECVDHPDRFEPIPLTEEWLVKFGFEKVEYDSDKHGYGVEYILEVYGIGGFILEYQDDFSIVILGVVEELGIAPNIDLFKHVHQLQNLYIALTGEELTLNKEDE